MSLCETGREKVIGQLAEMMIEVKPELSRAEAEEALRELHPQAIDILGAGLIKHTREEMLQWCREAHKDVFG